MAEPKSLQGPPPVWQDAGRRGELSATWNVADAIGVVRAQLRFLELILSAVAELEDAMARSKPKYR
jgi:hypothetical protein